MNRFPERRLLAAVPLLLLLAGGCGKSIELSPLPADAIILAFGDSLTHGTGAGRDGSYPAVLERLSGRKVINAGVPGEVTADGLKRLPSLLDQHEPALLILCHGGNDMLKKQDSGRTAENLERMIRMAQGRGAEVVLLGVPSPGIFLSAADFYKAVARDAGALYIEEPIARVLSKASLKSDPIHPNGEGYRQIAEHIHAALQKAGAF
jgi:acyl-CoA thioesterase-1